MESKKIELIKKVKALADRGVGGEKEDAAKLLEKLMKKYGIEEADISEDIEELQEFSYHGEFERKLLVQIFYKHFPDITDSGRVRTLPYGKGSRSTFLISCTKAQGIEIAIEFDFYRELWKEEVDFFYQAFLQKHDIFPQKAYEQQPSKLSLKDIYRMRMMMQGLSDKTLHPRISNINSYSSNGI